MGNHSVSIVPRQSKYPNNVAKSKEIIKWLISKDIITSEESHCVLSDDKRGYAISEGAKKVTLGNGFKFNFTDSEELELTENELPFDLKTNGLEIFTERNFFDTGENYTEELICPSCEKNIADEDWSVQPWIRNETFAMQCPLCKKDNDIEQYYFEPECGFSDLGFKFWNWPDFTEEFILEFQKKLKCEISIVFEVL